MKALITGAGGFAGSHLAQYLLHQGVEVLGLARQHDDLARLKPILGQIQVERGDVRDGVRLTQILRESRPERVFHLAAIASPGDSVQNPQITYEANFIGTLNLLEGVRQTGLDCRVLFVSSSEVYGTVNDEDLPLREEAPLRPAHPYAGSKAAGELLAFQYFRCYGMRVVRVRPFHHTGPGHQAAFVCSSLARQVAEIQLAMRDATVHIGNPTAIRDFTDVRDIVRGYSLVLEKGEPGDVYQLCSGRPVSIDAILRMLTAAVPAPIKVVVDPSRTHSHGARAAWGVAAKVERIVGWKPQYSLEATLLDLEKYWEDALRSTPSVKT